MLKNKIFLVITFVSFTFYSCNKTSLSKVDTIIEKVKKVWIVLSVKEDGNNVYTQGGASNIKLGYSKFVLDLSKPPAVTLIEVDGITFTGIYEIVGETKLILKNLSPAPNGTNGTIEFTIKKIDDTQFELTRETTNPKTGGTSNTYILTTKP